MLASATSTVAQGSVLLAVPLAVVAGLLSFVSPCVLPLVPGYLSFLGGAAGAASVGSDSARPSGARTIFGALAMRGAVLSVAYCAGLGIPFLLAAAATDRVPAISAFIRRHAPLVMRIGGAFLVVIGLLEITGLWGSMVNLIQDQIGSFTPSF